MTPAPSFARVPAAPSFPSTSLGSRASSPPTCAPAAADVLSPTLPVSPPRDACVTGWLNGRPVVIRPPAGSAFPHAPTPAQDAQARIAKRRRDPPGDSPGGQVGRRTVRAKTVASRLRREGPTQAFMWSRIQRPGELATTLRQELRLLTPNGRVPSRKGMQALEAVHEKLMALTPGSVTQEEFEYLAYVYLGSRLPRSGRWGEVGCHAMRQAFMQVADRFNLTTFSLAQIAQGARRPAGHASSEATEPPAQGDTAGRIREPVALDAMQASVPTRLDGAPPAHDSVAAADPQPVADPVLSFLNPDWFA